MSDFDPSAAATEIDVTEAFRVVFDKGNDGFASVSELRDILTKIGTPGDILSNAEFDELISEATVMGGKINYEDFVKTLMSRKV